MQHVWPNDFPLGYGFTSISRLKNFAEYTEAKNGNYQSAAKIVKLCIKEEKMNQIKRTYPNAVYLPIVGINQIPIALANAIGNPVCNKLHIIQPLKRKYLNAMERMLHKPQFQNISLPKQDYIIVEDVVTQGGTISAVKNHIQKYGGNVLAVVALAYSTGSYQIAPTQETVGKIITKFKVDDLNSFLNYYGITSDFRFLTNAQLQYLLNFSNINNIERRLVYYKEDHKQFIQSLH